MLRSAAPIRAATVSSRPLIFNRSLYTARSAASHLPSNHLHLHHRAPRFLLPSCSSPRFSGFGVFGTDSLPTESEDDDEDEYEDSDDESDFNEEEEEEEFDSDDEDEELDSDEDD